MRWYFLPDAPSGFGHAAKRWCSMLLLACVVVLGGLNLLHAQEKYKSYFFKNGEVVFEFDLRHYMEANAADSLETLDFADLDIHTVAITGNFNNWSKKGWRMKRVGPHTYQLRKRVEDFNDLFNWEFKFLINGRYVVDPNSPYGEEKIIPNTIWEGVYNLDVYDCRPVENGNVRFFLEGHPNAGQVILTGSFNGWHEHALSMSRVEGGWAMSLQLPSGRYEYKFIVDGEWMHDPANPKRVHNEHGTLNSVLYITKSVEFVLDGYPDARKVILAGSFNDWKTNDIRMSRTPKGWAVSMDLTAGKHYYKFIIDGEWITDPENPLTEYDGSGNLNSVLLVQ